MTLLDAALDLASHGFAVVPVRTDGSKAPAVQWQAYQRESPNVAELRAWFNPEGMGRAPAAYDGFGVICGDVSGGLELLEVEGRAAHLAGELERIMTEHGLADLWARLCAGWLEVSPSGGMHWLYRVEGGARPNTKLARRRNPENPRLVDVLIETRGQGGFCVLAPSAGRSHPTGKAWQTLAGGPATCPVITAEERDALYALAAMLDEMPTVEPILSTPSEVLGGRQTGEAARPGDDYNARATWAEILEPLGWTMARKIGDGYAWTRPGKDVRDGISATTGTARDGVDRLYVFSTSTEFEAETPYSKFGAYALLHHRGDHAAAARELRRTGYGAPSPERRLSLVGDHPQTGPSPLQAAHTGALSAPQAVDGATVHTDADGPAEPLSLFERDVQAKHYDLRVIEEARRRVILDREGEAPPFDVGTLAEVLAREPEPAHRVLDLIPSGAFTLIVAERKTGKTTLTLGLTRCLLTGEDFLGGYAVRPLTGRVAFLNYEVSGQQLARWAAEAEIPHDRFLLVNLRGRRNPLGVPEDRERLATYLREREVEAIIVDPFSRAFVGKSQNDAAEVQPWLLGLDQFARTEVGATEVILTAHTGWNGERARGSSALEGHPDVTITMTRDDEKRARYLSAEGRDVLVEEDELAYDPSTRRLTMAGIGSRKAAKARAKTDQLAVQVVDIVIENPGIITSAIEKRLREEGVIVRNGEVGKAARQASAMGHLRQEHGPKNSTIWWPRIVDNSSHPQSSPVCAGSTPRDLKGTGSTHGLLAGMTERGSLNLGPAS